MSTEGSNITLVERKIGRQWLITSPDLAGLYVAHTDLDAARRAVPGAVEMLRDMAGRRSGLDRAGATTC